MVRALAEEGHRVTLVSFAEPTDTNADLSPLNRVCEEIALVPAPAMATGGDNALGRLATLASRLPYGAWKFRSRDFTRRLEQQFRDQRYDLMICDGIYNAQNLPPAHPVPTLLNKDDVEHLIIRRYLAFERSKSRRLYGMLEAVKVKRWERMVCRQMRSILACSDVDRLFLQQLAPDIPISVLPNVVDTEHYVPTDGGEPLTVLYQGGMDWHPNRDAVEFFASTILPQLRARVPGVRFRVAGRAPSNDFRRQFAANRDIEFTGTVPDMRDEIAKAAVCVVPLRIGSGTRLKILEAGAMAKSIVSTPLGAEGLELREGEEIVLAKEPEVFAEAVASLLRDAGRRHALGRAARLRVEKHYSFPVFQAALRGALEGLFA